MTIPRARESVFELATQNETYERTLLPYGPIAGVVEVKLPEGGTLQRGALREARLTDGSVLVEEILEHDVPTRHRYKWTGGLKPPMAWLLRSGEGTWTFSEVTDGTRLESGHDVRVSTLEKYVAALGLQLELNAVPPKKPTTKASRARRTKK